MLRFTSFFSAALCSGSMALAQSDHCSDIFKYSAFNTSQISTSESILSSSKDVMCSRDFTRVEDIRTYARSGGWTLDYGPLSNSLSDAKRTDNNRFSIQETEFCKSSTSDLNYKFGQQSNRVVTDNAVAAWSKCMDGDGRPYLTYEVLKRSSVAVGNIHRKAKSGLTKFYVEGVSITPTGSAICRVGTKLIEPALFGEDGLEITSIPTAIECSKTDGELGFVSVSVQTNHGSIGPMILPSREKIDLDLQEALDANKRLRDFFTSITPVREGSMFSIYQGDADLSGKVHYTYACPAQAGFDLRNKDERRQVIEALCSQQDMKPFQFRPIQRLNRNEARCPDAYYAISCVKVGSP